MPFVESRARSTLTLADRILCVLGETLVHPRWEHTVTGSPIGRTSPERLTRLQRALVWKSLQQYRNANPRDAGYMLRLADETLGIAKGHRRADLLTTAWVSANLDPNLLKCYDRWWSVDSTRTTRARHLIPELRSRGYDAVVMLYPDANGSGWGALEDDLGRLGVPLIVLNGRRRLFEFDAATRRALRLRRFLERSWIFESVMTAAIVPIGLILALYDAVAVPSVGRHEQF